jgi:hypothetical protein
MGSATMRAVESTMPPGGVGTTRLTGAALRERHRSHLATGMGPEAGRGRYRGAMTELTFNSGLEGGEQTRDDELTLAP